MKNLNKIAILAHAILVISLGSKSYASPADDHFASGSAYRKYIIVDRVKLARAFSA